MLGLISLTPLLFWRVLEVDIFTHTLLAPVVIGHFVLCIILYLVLRYLDERTEEAQKQVLLVSSAKFVTLYENSPIPYVTLDNEGRVVMYNPAAVKLFETTTAGIPGLNVTESIFLDDENESSILQSKINSKLTLVEQEAKLRTVTGSLRWVLFSTFVYEDTGQKLMSFIDITRQKAIDAAKTDFVALATHQLRTPITAIRWNAELLERNLKDVQTPEQANYLAKINRNVLRMLALINDFLSVSKLEMGTFATSIEKIDLTNFCDGIIDEFEQRLLENKIVFKRQENPSHLQFETDPRLLNIILSNLISNSVKYVTSGGEVSYQYELEGDNLIITVSDTGIGIPKNEQGQLFTKFFRASNASTHKTTGTGLGLYIVKQSVEKLGGAIELVSEEGKGTTFTITLPSK